MGRDWYVLEVAMGRETEAAELVAALIRGLDWRMARRSRIVAAGGRASVDGACGDEGEAVTMHRPLAVTWVPQEYRYVRASRHAKARTRAVRAKLLPGYCLAAIDGDRTWQALRELSALDGARLVYGAITVDRRPAKVPRPDMDRLMATAEQFRPYTTASVARHRLRVGDTETVRAGALAGHAVRIEALGERTVEALLPMLGSVRSVRLPIEAFVCDEAA